MGTKHHIPFLDLKSLDTPYRDELKAAVCAVIDSGRYIGGPEVESFEHTLATATGTQYAVGVSNGLDALRLSLRAAIELGYIHRGDGIIVAANTYIASILAITDNDLRPILVEPSPDHLQPGHIAHQRSHRTCRRTRHHRLGNNASPPIRQNMLGRGTRQGR